MQVNLSFALGRFDIIQSCLQKGTLQMKRFSPSQNKKKRKEKKKVFLDFRFLRTVILDLPVLGDNTGATALQMRRRAHILYKALCRTDAKIFQDKAIWVFCH